MALQLLGTGAGTGIGMTIALLAGALTAEPAVAEAGRGHHRAERKHHRRHDDHGKENRIAFHFGTGFPFGHAAGHSAHRYEHTAYRGHRRHGYGRHRAVYGRRGCCGYHRTRWVAPLYETRYDDCGNPYRVLIRSGYHEKIWVPVCDLHRGRHGRHHRGGGHHPYGHRRGGGGISVHGDFRF